MKMLNKLAAMAIVAFGLSVGSVAQAAPNDPDCTQGAILTGTVHPDCLLPGNDGGDGNNGGAPVNVTTGDTNFETGDNTFQTGDNTFQTGDNTFQTGDNTLTGGQQDQQTNTVVDASTVNKNKAFSLVQHGMPQAVVDEAAGCGYTASSFRFGVAEIIGGFSLGWTIPEKDPTCEAFQMAVIQLNNWTFHEKAGNEVEAAKYKDIYERIIAALTLQITGEELNPKAFYNELREKMHAAAKDARDLLEYGNAVSVTKVKELIRFYQRGIMLAKREQKQAGLVWAAAEGRYASLLVQALSYVPAHMPRAGIADSYAEYPFPRRSDYKDGREWQRKMDEFLRVVAEDSLDAPASICWKPTAQNIGERHEKSQSEVFVAKNGGVYKCLHSDDAVNSLKTEALALDLDNH
jgi:hypothetical protein